MGKRESQLGAVKGHWERLDAGPPGVAGDQRLGRVDGEAPVVVSAAAAAAAAQVRAPNSKVSFVASNELKVESMPIKLDHLFLFVFKSESKLIYKLIARFINLKEIQFGSSGIQVG